MKETPHILDLDFVYIEMYYDYMISTIKEGVAFSMQHLRRFHKIFETHYPQRPFVSIADRKYDYTIDPTCYLHPAKNVNLAGITILCHSKSSFEIAQFEKTFYKGPFETFYSLDECIQWAKKTLEEF